MGVRGGSYSFGYPPGRPFALLAIYFCISILQLATVAARPPFANTPVRALWALAAVSAVLALAVGIAWRARAEGALPWIVASGMLVSAASAAVSVGGQGQLVAGFYLGVLGLYSGYFLSARAVTVLVVVATVTYGSALVVSWRLDSAAYVIAVVVMVDGMTLVVSSLVQRLRAVAVLDPLTGVLNRRGLAERAEELHALDARRHGSTTVGAIDLDGFKAYNDERGHDAGDRLLVEVAQCFSGVLRETDLLARVGGDEFVLLLPDTTMADAEGLMARMHQSRPRPWSCGLTQWEPGEPFAAALRRADAAMYRDKAHAKLR